MSNQIIYTVAKQTHAYNNLIWIIKNKWDNTKLQFLSTFYCNRKCKAKNKKKE